MFAYDRRPEQVWPGSRCCLNRRMPCPYDPYASVHFRGGALAGRGMWRSQTSGAVTAGSQRLHSWRDEGRRGRGGRACGGEVPAPHVAAPAAGPSAAPADAGGAASAGAPAAHAAPAAPGGGAAAWGRSRGRAGGGAARAVACSCGIWGLGCHRCCGAGDTGCVGRVGVASFKRAGCFSGGRCSGIVRTAGRGSGFCRAGEGPHVREGGEVSTELRLRSSWLARAQSHGEQA